MEENFTDSWTEKERQQALMNALAVKEIAKNHATEIKKALEKKNAEARKRKTDRETERVLNMTYAEVCAEDEQDYNERMYGDQEDY
mgnify:CR=1 FL=1